MKPSLACAAVVLAALSSARVGSAEPPTEGPIKLLATIEVPGEPLKAFDIAWVDPGTHRFYLADRSNAGIDIIDTKNNSYLGRVGGFTGDDKRGIDYGGPNGVLVIPELHQLWAGDGGSRVQVVDLSANPPRIEQTIQTGGKQRADELAYDAKDGIAMVANNSDSPAFVSFISTRDYKILGKLTFPNTFYGVEQSVWDPASDRFYLAVPVVSGVMGQLKNLVTQGVGGEVVEIDPTAMKVTRKIKVYGCAGSGLALGPNDNLLQGCWRSSITLIVNKTSGSVISISQVGGSDEVWFNSGDNRYFLGAGFNHDAPVLGIIDALNNKWIQNVRTTPWAHSVAADSSNNHVFVPLTPNDLAFDNNRSNRLNCKEGCIGVYGER